MLLNLGSLILIVLYTSYSIFDLFRRRDRINAGLGAIMAMLIAFIGSAAMGGITVQVYGSNMVLTVLIAALFVLASGYSAGRIYSLQAAINGVLAGWIGAQAGALLGVLLFTSNKVILIVTVAFLIFMFLAQKWIEWQSNRMEIKKKPVKGSKNKANSTKVSYSGTIILAAVIVIVGGSMWMQKDRIQTGIIGQAKTQLATVDEKNDLQVAVVQVTRSGLSPRNTDFKSKQMVKAIVNLDATAGTGLKLKSESLGIDAELTKGDNVFLMNNPQPGTYAYTIEPGGFAGTFTVK